MALKVRSPTLSGKAREGWGTLKRLEGGVEVEDVGHLEADSID